MRNGEVFDAEPGGNPIVHDSADDRRYDRNDDNSSHLPLFSGEPDSFPHLSARTLIKRRVQLT